MQEIMLYLLELESDLRNESVAILSEKSWTVVWPEVREFIKFDITMEHYIIDYSIADHEKVYCQI